MADVNSNININFNTAAALAQLRQLQAGLSKFHQTLAEGNLAAANAQKGLNAQLLQSIGATGKFSASQVKVAGSTLAFTSALEKNKLSLREYYRYTMAAATANTRVMGKAFAQEREIINRARRDRVKALQSQYIQMNKANAGFMDAIRVMPKSLQMASGKFTELGTRIQYAAQRQQFLNQLLKQGSTQLLNFGKNTQWAGRQLMVGLTMPLALFGAAAAKAFRELDAEIVKFRRVYGDAFTNDAEVNAAVENIRRLGNEYTKYGVSVTKTMAMAATAAAAGFQGNDLTAQVETATKLSVLGQIEQQQALETTISLQSAFGISSEDLAKKIDFLNAVENQTLLSIEDLTIAIPKAAPVVKQLGGSVEDLAFFLTAMKEGGINASEGANALKSGLASLINPSDKAAKFMGALGINIKGLVEANKGDIKGTVVGFARALDELDPLNRARAIEQMFGKFQFSRLSTLFQNVTKDGSQASRAFQLAGSSIEELAILSEREMKKIEESTGVKFQAALEQFKQEIMPLGKAFLEALTPVVKFFGGLFEKFNGLSDQTKKVVATIIGVVAGLGPIVLMTFGLLANGVANVIKFFAMLRGGIAKLNGQTSIMGASFNYMTQEQIESAAASQSLHQTHTKLIQVFNVEKASVSALAASYSSLSTQMRAMAAQNPALFAGGMGGAKVAASKLPPVRKYIDGVISVPGPKGAGDVVPAMLSPGEAVIPTETTDKYRGLITAMFQDKVPGFMAGRLPGGPGRGIPLSSGPEAVRKAQQAKYRRRDDARQGYNEPHPEKKSGPTFVGMPKSASEASQSRQILDKISNSVKAGRFADMPPTDFGTMLQSFSGRSFPARGVGGVYRKPNGQIVVVKPTIDDKTALAEVRATQIAREVHGLVSPRQTIKTMIDPTDPTGQRKFIVVESPYDPRIASMSGKFSKSDMIKQLVASTLRGDKDLQKPNLSGNVLADVGTAGVFDRASGFRDFAKVMPSMEQQAIVNLLGVKGGAKKFFAQETSSIAASMSPSQYDAAIKAEISKSIPRLERVLKSFDLNPEEQIAYGNMLDRLRKGAKTDWAALHPMHARAGEGVAKLELGNFEKFKNLPESREQVARLQERLAEDAVQQLKKLPPEQQERVLAAMRKQKPPATAAMSQSKMIKFVEENMIYKDGLFHDKKSLDAGRETAGKTYQEVMKKVFYQMGLVEKEGAFVSDKKINMPSRLRDAMSPEGKASGGWRGSVPKNSTLFKVLDAEERNFRAQNMIAGKNDPLGVVREKLSALGYTEKEIARALRSELSHIDKTGESGRGPAKYLKGSAMFDLRLLNNYMNTKARSQNILDWNSKSGNPLNLTPKQLLEFQKSANFMKPGSHPTTLNDIKLVQKAAQLDVLADEYLKQQKTKPKGFPNLGQVNSSRGVLALLDDRIGSGYYNSSRPVFNLASGPDQTQKVLVDPRNEFKVDTVTGKVTKLTSANTGAKPAGAVPDSGSSRDTRTTTESRTQKVATRTQARSFRRGFTPPPGFSMPGRAKGDPELSKAAQGRVTNAMQKQAQLLKQRNNLTQKEINQALTQYRTRLIAAEVEKRSHHEKQKAMADERKQIAQSSQTAKESARQAKADAKAAVKEKRMARQQKVGGISGGLSMGLGTAGMGLMMAGQQTAGMAVMGASAVAGLAPMFAGMGPFGLALTAVAAVGGGLFLLDRAAKKAAEAQSKMVDQTYATTEKMKGIGALTGKVGASEIYDRKRKVSASDRYTTGFERGKEQFGATFLENEVGKDVMSGFVKNMESGTDQAAKTMAIQLAGYVSDGVMSAEQAHSVASQIGINLNNSTLTSQISGQLLDLIGPSGEDLLKNPLEVRVKLVEEQRSLSASLTDLFKKEMANPTDEFTDFTANDNAQKMAADVAAMGVQNLEFNRSQQDSLNAQYDKELKILETRKAATTDAAKIKAIDAEILALSGKREKGLATLRKTNEGILKDQMDAFKTAQGKDDVEDSFFDSLKSQVRAKAESTGQGAFADTFLKSSADLDSKEIEVKINTIVASGSMPTETATSLLEMFGDDEDGLEKFLDVTTKMQDPGKVTQLINSLGGFKNKNKKVVKEIIAKIANGDPEEADKLVSTIALMEKMAGKEINIEAFFEQEDAMTKLEDLQKELEEVEKMPTPITKKAISELDTDGDGTVENMDALLAVWDQWGNLPDETKKTVVQEYITILRTITDGDIDAAIANEKAKAPGAMAGYIDSKYNSPEAREALAAKIAADRVMQQTKQDLESKKAGLGTGSGDGSGKKVDPYEFLLQRLKNVRNAAINAAGGIKELNKALTEGNSKSVQNRFRGVEQQMNAKKMNRQFIDYAMGLSPEEQAKIFTTAGPRIKTGKNKGKIADPYKKGKFLKDTFKPGDVVLSEEGKTMNKGLDAAVVGEFNSSVSKSILLLNEQEGVRRKLVGLGYDSVSIEKILADEYTTAAIFAGKLTDEELKTNVVLSKQLTNRQKINDLIFRGTKAINEQNDIKKIPSVIKFLGGQGVSATSMRDIIGDPGQLAEAIAAMEDYESGAEGAADRLKEIVAGLKAIQENSNIKVAIDFAVKTTAEKIQAGAEAANKVMNAKRTAYNYLNTSELTNATSAYKDGRPAQQVGKIATANVAARYAAAGAKIPTMPADATIKGIQSKRSALGKTIGLASSRLGEIQNQRSSIQDSISNAQDTLDASLDAVNKKYDDIIKGIQNTIKGFEKNIKGYEKQIDAEENKIKTQFTDKIEAFNKENQTLSNDLAIMDKAAEDINEKYDKQVEALQKVNELNQQIVESQGQQLNLADALTSGDIAAAARAAQEMRASSAANQGDALMQGLENSRTNELDSLTSATGMTRKQITERQFVISQEIYKLETDPARLVIEKEILRLKDLIVKEQEKIVLEQEKIDKEEENRVLALQQAEAAHAKTIADLQSQLVEIEKQEAAQAAILKTLEDEEAALRAQEEYLAAIAEEAVAVDDTTGMTLEKWEETKDKVLEIKDLAEAYAIALEAAAVAADAASGSWSSILDTINDIPSSVTTESIINEIRNITENITRYITTVDLGGSTGNTGNTGNTGSTNKAPGTAWVSDGKGGWTKPAKPGIGDWSWDDNKGWTKEGSKTDTGDKTTSEQNAALAAAAKAEAEAKAKADALAAQKAADAAADATNELLNGGSWWSGTNFFRAKGGLINPMKFAMGGLARGTDTVPAMLTPGEFIMSKYAVQAHGIDTMKAINSGKTTGGAVYNNTYALTVNAKTDASPNEIAQAVMSTIKQVDDRRIRGVSLNAR